MQKPKILYASPFQPIQSGISDYSEILVKALQEKYVVTLLVKDYEISNLELANSCEVLRYDKDVIPYNEFQHIIYNIGNQPFYHDYIYRCCLEHPGLIILHEFSIYFLTVGVHNQDGDVLGTVYQQEGARGIHKIKNAIQNEHQELLECKSLSSELPLNKEILQSNNKFMVHSEYVCDKLIESGYIEPERIRKINHVALINDDTEYIQREVLFQKFGIPNDVILLASFGFISPNKLNHVICETILKLANKLEQKICYVMVGEGGYINHYVDNKTIFKTGYTSLEEFNSFIKYADVILNLRYPTMGETSGALIRILGLGKVCIINKGGWFSEIPDTCSVKLETSDLEQSLEKWIVRLIQDPSLRKEYENNAREYIAREYNEKSIVNQIQAFIQ